MWLCSETPGLSLGLSSLLGLSCLWLHLAGGLGGVTERKQPLFDHHSAGLQPCAAEFPSSTPCPAIANWIISNLSLIEVAHHSTTSVKWPFYFIPLLLRRASFWSDVWTFASGWLLNSSDPTSLGISWSMSYGPSSDPASVGSAWHQTNQLTSLNGSLDCLKSFSSHSDPCGFYQAAAGKGWCVVWVCAPFVPECVCTRSFSPHCTSKEFKV